jgi:hypothetical protein
VQCGLKQSGSLYLTSIQRIRNNIVFIIVFALIECRIGSETVLSEILYSNYTEFNQKQIRNTRD